MRRRQGMSLTRGDRRRVREISSRAGGHEGVGEGPRARSRGQWMEPGGWFCFKQKTAYEILAWTGVQTCALPICERRILLVLGGEFLELAQRRHFAAVVIALP